MLASGHVTPKSSPKAPLTLVGADPADEAELIKVYSDIFEDVISRDEVFGPTLRKVKTVYDAFLRRVCLPFQGSLHANAQSVPSRGSGYWGSDQGIEEAVFLTPPLSFESAAPSGRATGDTLEARLQRENEELRQCTDRLHRELEEERASRASAGMSPSVAWPSPPPFQASTLYGPAAAEATVVLGPGSRHTSAGSVAAAAFAAAARAAASAVEAPPAGSPVLQAPPAPQLPGPPIFMAGPGGDGAGRQRHLRRSAPGGGGRRPHGHTSDPVGFAGENFCSASGSSAESCEDAVSDEDFHDAGSGSGEDNCSEDEQLPQRAPFGQAGRPAWVPRLDLSVLAAGGGDSYSGRSSEMGGEVSDSGGQGDHDSGGFSDESGCGISARSGPGSEPARCTLQSGVRPLSSWLADEGLDGGLPPGADDGPNAPGGGFSSQPGGGCGGGSSTASTRAASPLPLSRSVQVAPGGSAPAASGTSLSTLQCGAERSTDWFDKHHEPAT